MLALISLGLSPTIGRAVLDGFRTSGGTFERTPKQGNGARLAALPEGLHLRDLLPEALTLAYALLTLGVALLAGAWALLPLPLLYTLGSAAVLRLSLGEFLAARRPARPPGPPSPPRGCGEMNHAEISNQRGHREHGIFFLSFCALGQVRSPTSLPNRRTKCYADP